MGKDSVRTKRVIEILLFLLNNPNGKTIKELMDEFGVSKPSIKRDLRILRETFIKIDCDNKHRYKLIQRKPYQQLKDLLHFSEEDQILLSKAIDQIQGYDKRGQRLKKKLSALYDFKRLGHAYLRKPYLTKVDLLEKAQKEEKVAILKNYRSSNSNEIKDRKVEPFHLNPAEDLLHCFDLNQNELRHFRISRIERVQVTEENWQNQGKHYVIASDPFRIVDSKQVNVHLRLKVGAYNELIERFPLTENHIKPDAEKDVYDFQCKVNAKFIGLTNFILGFHHQGVEILEPQSLVAHLESEIEKFQEKLKKF